MVTHVTFFGLFQQQPLDRSFPPPRLCALNPPPLQADYEKVPSTRRLSILPFSDCRQHKTWSSVMPSLILIGTPSPFTFPPPFILLGPPWRPHFSTSILLLSSSQRPPYVDELLQGVISVSFLQQRFHPVSATPWIAISPHSVATYDLLPPVHPHESFFQRLAGHSPKKTDFSSFLPFVSK